MKHLLVLALVLIVAGCGAKAPAPKASPSTSPGVHTLAPSASPSVIDDTARDDLTTESLQTWSSFDKVTPTQIRVHFDSGDPKCYGVRVVVKESKEKVEVATVTGLVPGAPDMCTKIGRQASVLVPLAEDLGDRKVTPLADVELKK